MLIPFLLTVLPTPLPATAPPSTTALASVTTISQDEDEVEDKRPEIKEALEKLKDHIGERGEQDQEAVSVIDGLLQEFPKCGPKDRKSIVTGIGKCFDACVSGRDNEFVTFRVLHHRPGQCMFASTAAQN